MREQKDYYTEENLVTTIEDNGYTDMEFANGEWIRVKTPEEAYNPEADEYEIVKLMLEAIE